MYLVGHLFTPTHNSVLEARELAGLFLFNEQLILHSAHEFKTAQEAFRRVLSLIEGRDHLRKRVKKVRTSHGEEGIELVSGARLRFVARSTGSGRGFSGDCVILDEAYNLSGTAMSALMPTLSARVNPQMWYASSAGMPSSEQLLRVHDRGVSRESPRLAYFEWSADPALDLDDREAWAQANPALGIRITEEFVESERAALGDIEFGRERLGYWPEFTVEQIIDPDLWGKLVDPYSKVTDPVVFGVDATLERTKAAIAVAGRRGDGHYHVEIVDSRLGTGWVPGRLTELAERWKPAAVVLDPTGPAGAWLADLKYRNTDEYALPLQMVSGRELAQACGLFYETAVERQGLRHRDQEPLNAALASAKQRAVGDAWRWHRRSFKADISPLMAATLALHGFVVHGRDGGAPTLWI